MPKSQTFPKGEDPQTIEEWQTAADLAEFLLLVDSAEQYGLVTGPKVNVARAGELLARAAQMGIRPKPHDKLVKTFMGEKKAG